jgi:hypothetical protein
MPDIRTLLHDAAPSPARPLQMDVVRARARRSSTRRLVAWIAGLGAVMGLGVPVGSGLLPSAGEGDRVSIIDPRPTIESTPTTGQPPVTVGTDLPGNPGTLPTVDPPPESLPAPTISTTLPAATSSTTPTTAGSRYPAATACAVDTYGLDEGEARSCRFTATSRGGWNNYSTNLTSSLDKMPVVRITVIRGDDVMTYRSQEVDENGDTQYENCAEDIIQPGDLVEVRIDQAYVWIDGTEYQMGAGAGEGWGCTNRGPP